MQTKLKILFSICFVLLGTLAFSQVKETAKKLGEPESKNDSTRRFKIEQGLYIGANPEKNKGLIVVRKDLRIANPTTSENDKVSEKRFYLQQGQDIGTGSAYRSERMMSLKQRKDLFNSSKSKLKVKPEADTVQRNRIIIQDGRYVGAGPKKNKP
ncbi:hypothetical protein LV84_01352 [Algoriphagus ratkowskyi]|uniref:Uncharacterized protein n=1 Tax=Algoriphagus ratkowskyi TaxID=57028 RepID=A0A2W7RGM3_9BACT|nr:hypothetical protein [Algoriphagus ratkowskyi]PZX59321.1 hypothetical protein LV84_01352 [Algoriphagus ratkowskyi]TXD77412.1 hypothetical protein ESW18_11430 [Algoriphagus ratkowskyi]